MVQSLRSPTPFPGGPQQPSAARAASRRQLWMAVHLREPPAPGALESLAAWCHELTPVVSVEAPRSLLLELAGSLRLFGGLAAIKAMLAAELERRRVSFRACAAPTAVGALWSARHAGRDVIDCDRLSSHLSELPIHVTAWPPDVLDLLTELGIRRVGDCLRLPRDGFARRVGRRYLNDLDKALGRAPDPREAFEVVEDPSWRIDLTAECEDLSVLAEGLESLAESAAMELGRRQKQAQSLELFFDHLKSAPSVQTFSLVEPVHEKHRLLDPLLARLERVRLPEPAIALGLRVGDLQAMRLAEARLFDDRLFDDLPAREAVSEAVLVERLRARLGAEEVYGFGLAADHRPERVWIKLTGRLLARRSGLGRLSSSGRPLWILPEPLPLARAAARLRFQEPLRVDEEPERIESGWWDGADVQRDYYTAYATAGERLWIYQDRITQGWYLHGIFG